MSEVLFDRKLVMNPRHLFFMASIVIVAHSTSAAAHTRPNIVIILSDDMGYSDIGCYGGLDAKTPNLDDLAHGGVRFTQFYNTARCCPTRASLLTGLYPHQAGVGHMMDDHGVDGYRGNLNQQCVTIAEVLKPAGYRNYMVGKWHVTKDTRETSSQTNWPLQRGFDKYYGTLVGAGNFFNPNGLCRQNELITTKTDPEYQPEQFYYTDALSDNAVRFLRQHREETPNQPFFLYVAYTAAHWPMHALEKDIAKYHGKFDDGYAPHREARLTRLKELGLVAHDSNLSPAAEDWSRVENREWEARCMEVYCAMIDNMDAGIGRIVADLKTNGQFENTVFMFMQDNGACAEPAGRSSGTHANETFEGRPILMGPSVMPGPGDTFIAYGRGWANVSNTPFREYKHWVHEGGISTPLILHWSEGTSKDRKGQLETQPAHLIDLMATCVDLADANYPTEYQGHAIKPREGVSLRPALHAQPLNRQQPLYWEHESNKAIRDGRWKLVAKAHQPWELYDMDIDRIESNDLAEIHPDLVKRLSEQWEAYAERANVFPLRPLKPAAATNTGNTAQNRFELEPMTVLEKQDSPALVGRGIVILASIDTGSPDAQGVILSQGGSRWGYALSLDHGTPVFVVRTNSRLQEIRGAEPLSGKHQLRAELKPEGRISLQVDGKAVADDIDCPLITNQPGEGLLVGKDEGGAVGSYKTPHAFGGTITSLVLELTEAPENVLKK